MATHHRALPEGLTPVLDRVQRGQIFAVQEWLRAGKRIRVTERPGKSLSLLAEAIHTGFHSIVEQLLHAGRWSQRELAKTFYLARPRTRCDIHRDGVRCLILRP